MSNAASTSPLLFRCETAGEVTEALKVDGSDLFDEHTSRGAPDVDLGPERFEVTITARNDTTNDCRAMLTVVLDDPLGDRELVDGATGRVLGVRLVER